MSLTPQDFQSQTWLKLKEYYSARLEQAREDNDNSTLTPDQTARLRGRIFEIKEFLALETPPKQGANDIADRR